MCLFIVRNGKPITPGLSSDIMESITRDAVIALLSEAFCIETPERDVDRSELLAADEAFFCGYAWEVTPIRGIDGYGEVSVLTRRLQERFLAVAPGATADRYELRTPVYD